MQTWWGWKLGSWKWCWDVYPKKTSVVSRETWRKKIRDNAFNVTANKPLPQITMGNGNNLEVWCFNEKNDTSLWLQPVWNIGFKILKCAPQCEVKNMCKLSSWVVVNSGWDEILQPFLPCSFLHFSFEESCRLTLLARFYRGNSQHLMIEITNLIQPSTERPRQTVDGKKSDLSSRDTVHRLDDLFSMCSKFVSAFNELMLKWCTSIKYIFDFCSCI